MQFFKNLILVTAFMQVAVFSATLYAVRSNVLAPSGIESIMTYQSEVLLPSGVEPSDDNIDKAILDQTKHLLSEFESPDFARYLGTQPLKGDLGIGGLGPIEFYEIIGKPVLNNGGRWIVKYRAVQRILISNTFITPGETKKITFFMPYDPENIYVKERTDKEWPQKEFFFYYWQPPYHKKDSHYYETAENKLNIVEAELKGLAPPSINTQPQFPKLWESIRKNGELKIDLMLGFDKSASKPRDLGRSSYRFFRKYFESKGFKIDREVNKPNAPITEFVREATHNSPPIRIYLSVSSSDIDHPAVFARQARKAFENGTIVIYAGHAGLGGNLDLNTLAKLSSPDPENPIPIKFSPEYQIYFFDACASYYFYSQMYSLAKNGARDVDVITNGLPADYDTQNPELITFLKQFIELPLPGNYPNWHDILQKVEATQRCTYLLNVELK